MNFFLLSFYAPVAEEDKFSKYWAFRDALCKGLFAHAKPRSTVAIADIVTVAVVVATADVVAVVAIVAVRIKY